MYLLQIYKTGNIRNETLRHSNLVHSLTALYVIDSKDFARAQSIFTDLILADVNLSSVSINTGPSDEAPLESAKTLLSFMLKVVDLWVAGKFEVGKLREKIQS